METINLLFVISPVIAFGLGLLFEKKYLYESGFKKEITVLKKQKAEAELKIANIELEHKNKIKANLTKETFIKLLFETRGECIDAWNKIENFFVKNKDKYKQNRCVYGIDTTWYVEERYEIINPEYLNKPIDFLEIIK